jgi:hypothetical protein
MDSTPSPSAPCLTLSLIRKWPETRVGDIILGIPKKGLAKKKKTKNPYFFQISCPEKLPPAAQECGRKVLKSSNPGLEGALQPPCSVTWGQVTDITKLPLPLKQGKEYLLPGVAERIK